MAFEFQQLMKDLAVAELEPLYSPTIGEIDAKEYVLNCAKKVQEFQRNKQYPMEFDAPLGCQLELTYRCNQRCVHCYNQSGDISKKRPELPIEKWEDIAHQLGRIGVFECVISGGEPLMMGEDLYRIMDILSSYDIKFVFISNGMLLEKNTMKSLSKYQYKCFQISIDGHSPLIHDWMRGVDGSWIKAMRAADLVKEAGFTLVVAHCVVRQNVDMFSEMVDLCYAIGARRVVAGKYVLAGRAIVNSSMIELTEADKEKLKKTMREKINEYIKRMEIINSMEIPLALKISSIQPNQSLLIRPNGDVKVNCILPFKIGNVLDDNIIDLWREKGKNMYKFPAVAAYCREIKNDVDLITPNELPRLYVDEDISI